MKIQPNCKGFIQVTGVYNNGDTFLQEKSLPFTASLLPIPIAGMEIIEIKLAVPKEHAESFLAGLESGADLTLDGVPSLLEQS